MKVSSLRKKSFVSGSAWFVVGIASAVLSGWMLDISFLKSVFPGFVSMKVNTALCFLSAGSSLMLLRRMDDPRLKAVARALAGFVLLIGSLTLTEYFSGVDLGIDQLLYRDTLDRRSTFPGRMSILTAFNFAGLGASLLLLFAGRRRSVFFAALPPMAVSLSVLAVYPWGDDPRFRLALTVAVHTALTFIVLGLGILIAAASKVPFADRLHSEREINRVFGLAIGVLLILAVGTFQNQQQYRDTIRQRARTYEVLALTERTFSSLTDAQTAHREFLITGERAFLERSRAEAEKTDGYLEILHARVAGNEPQRARADVLKGLIQERKERFETTSRARMTEGLQAASTQISSRKGISLMDRIRSVKEEMITAENRLLEEREALKRVLAHNAQVTLFLGNAVSLSLLVFAFARLRDEVRRHKKSAQDLQESRGQFVRLFESLPDAAIVVDYQARIVQVNEQTEKMFGYARDELNGRLIETLIPRRFTEHVRHRNRYFADPQTRAMGAGLELFGMRKDGSEFPVDIMLSPVKMPQGLQVVSIVRNVTERKKIERQIQTLNMQLQHRLEEVSAANRELESFSYSVSHDLRAPLRAIDGFSKILEEDHGDRLDEEGCRLIGVVRGNTKKMGQLIDDLLAFSRLSRLEMAESEVDMTALAETVVEEMKQLFAAPEIILKPLPSTRADSALMKQVWSNLISNAFKFTRHASRPRVEIGGAKDADEKIYFVKDNGAGFDMAFADKLYGVFQRLHRSEEFEGTGVGLALVHRIVTRHGGRVWAEGKVDEGATFYFALPSKTLK